VTQRGAAKFFADCALLPPGARAGLALVLLRARKRGRARAPLSLVAPARSTIRYSRASRRGLFTLQRKAPPKRGGVLVSLLHRLAGVRPAVSIMPGATTCSAGDR
jgi:hypothetical protein